MGDRNKQQRRSPCLIPTDYVYDNSGKKANYQLQCSGLPRYSDGYFHAKLWYKVDGIHFFISFRGSSMEEINHKATLFIPVLHAKIYNYVLSASSENVSGPNLYVFWSTYKDVLARNENWDESHRALAEYVMSTISSDKQIMCKSMASLTFDDYDNAMNKLLEKSALNPTGRKNMRLKYFSILNVFTRTAEEADICPGNPLEYFIENVRRPRDFVAEIRNRFRKNHFSEQETYGIYAYIEQHMQEDSGYFGVALMLLAGMTAQEVCALTSDDVYHSEIFPDLLSIRISRECRLEIDESTKKKSFRTDRLMHSASRYRAVPMHPDLCMLFKLRMQHLMKEVNNCTAEEGCRYAQREPVSVAKQKSYGNYYLISQPTGNSSSPKYNMYLPKTLNSLATAVLCNLNIKLPSTIVIEVDDKPREIHFTHNPIDFRSNMAYYLRTKCLFNKDELNYIIGRTMTGTDARYYIDWISDYAQYYLFNKLARWQIEPDMCHVTTSMETVTSYAFNKSILTKGKVGVVYIRIIPASKSVIAIHIHAKNGMSGCLQRDKH